MRNAVMILFFGILLLGCVAPPPGAEEAGNESAVPVISAPNTTGQPDPQVNILPSMPPGQLLSQGDYAWVWYTLWVDGEIHDTNNATLAEEAGIYNPARPYEPLGFSVDFDSGMINGFILNVLSMEVDETVVFDVGPEMGYGLHDPAKVAVVPRYYNKSMHETVPLSYFEERELDSSVGTGYDTPYGQVFVESVDEEEVVLFYMMQAGQEFAVNGIPQRVVAVQNLTAAIEYLLEPEDVYQLPHPGTGAPTLFTVTEKSEQEITLDGNHPLANKTLRFSVTLFDAVPAAYR